LKKKGINFQGTGGFGKKVTPLGKEEIKGKKTRGASMGG